MQYLGNIDASITTFLAHIIPHTSLTQILFSFFSFAGGSFFIWLIPLGFLLFTEEQKDKTFLVYFAIGVLLATMLTNEVLKNVFMRTRPYVIFGIYAPICPLDFSFPSGHATTSFAAATMLASFDYRRKYWYYGTAFLVSYSRIFLYCHFFFDVLAGAVIGNLVSRAILLFHQDYRAKNHAKKYPQAKK